MMDGDEIAKVLVYSDDYRHLKAGGHFLKAQVEQGRAIDKGVFIKKYHFTNSFGQKAPGFIFD